jgi:hypothetical protein
MEADMALSLGVKTGDVVDIAARWVAVLSVDNYRCATLLRDDGSKIVVSTNRMTEVAPDVWVGLGPYSARYRLRLLVEAPRHLAITRRSARRERS